MTEQIGNNEGGGSATVDRHPDQCPICHSKITPTARFAKPGGAGYGSVFEVVYSCPNSECREFFIAYFSNPDTAGPYRLSGMRPHEPVKLALEESVKAV